MRLVYHGVHDGIEIDLPNGGLLQAKNGEPFEVGDELGSSLLEQDTFALEAEPKPTKPAAPAAAKE